MKIMVLGSGGREHAIIKKLQKDSEANEVIAVPGNGGISLDCECIKADTDNPEEMLQIAKDRGVDMTIVGPEAPLSLGIVDIFVKEGLKIFGPGKEGAKLESSKIFSKSFMKRHNIPTAGFHIAENIDEGLHHLSNRKMPCVIKFDGLAAGKGVRIIENFNEGREFLREIFDENIFNAVEKKAVIEDYISGPETSYLVFTDTRNFIPMVPARDYKKAFDGDAGPNTGGMGSYSPPCDFSKELEDKIVTALVEPTMKGMQKDGMDYRGVLYFGIIISPEGPYILEYNVRFGDPETQVILPRMKTPLTDIMEYTISANLKDCKVEWSREKAVCVILASEGYPGLYGKGAPVSGLSDVEGVTLFHAGTRKSNNALVTSGGRVLGITGLDKDLYKAREKVYRAAKVINFRGKQYRRDIGA